MGLCPTTTKNHKKTPPSGNFHQKNGSNGHSSKTIVKNRYAILGLENRGFLETDSYFDTNGNKISEILQGEDSLIKEDDLGIPPKPTKTQPAGFTRSTPILKPRSESSSSKNDSNGEQ